MSIRGFCRVKRAGKPSLFDHHAIVSALFRALLKRGIAASLAAIAVAFLAASILSQQACESSSDTRKGWQSSGQGQTVKTNITPSLRAIDLRTEPSIRVRLATGQTSAMFQSDASVQLAVPGHGADQPVQTPVMLSRQGDVFLLKDSTGRSLRINSPVLQLSTTSQPLSFDGVQYAGTIIIHAQGNRFEIVNQIPLETYLPGVLAGELYKHWDEETFRAQAVAARSYAIAEMIDNQHRQWDVVSGQRSQMFTGMDSHSKAVQAAQATRGQVLWYRSDIVRAYYSSCAGGAGQDAAAIFPAEKDIAPLRGRVLGSWGSNSRFYQWGPIVRDRAELSERIKKWGQINKHEVANIGLVVSILASQKNHAQRPTHFQLMDHTGRKFTLNAEQTRAACNQDVRGLADLNFDQKLKSSYMTALPQDNEFVFQGRGFGHGVGLDQHGAQQMAQRGYNYASILAFYYPQSELRQLYR